MNTPCVWFGNFINSAAPFIGPDGICYPVDKRVLGTKLVLAINDDIFLFSEKGKALDLFGGKFENSESPFECIVREVKEECPQSLTLQYEVWALAKQRPLFSWEVVDNVLYGAYVFTLNYAVAPPWFYDVMKYVSSVYLKSPKSVCSDSKVAGHARRIVGDLINKTYLSTDPGKVAIVIPEGSGKTLMKRNFLLMDGVVDIDDVSDKPRTLLTRAYVNNDPKIYNAYMVERRCRLKEVKLPETCVVLVSHEFEAQVLNIPVVLRMKCVLDRLNKIKDETKQLLCKQKWYEARCHAYALDDMVQMINSAFKTFVKGVACKITVNTYPETISLAEVQKCWMATTALLRLKSQLNGANGEHTGLDDVDTVARLSLASCLLPRQYVPVGTVASVMLKRGLYVQDVTALGVTYPSRIDKCITATGHEVEDYVGSIPVVRNWYYVNSGPMFEALGGGTSRFWCQELIDKLKEQSARYQNGQIKLFCMFVLGMVQAFRTLGKPISILYAGCSPGVNIPHALDFALKLGVCIKEIQMFDMREIDPLVLGQIKYLGAEWGFKAMFWRQKLNEGFNGYTIDNSTFLFSDVRSGVEQAALDHDMLLQSYWSNLVIENGGCMMVKYNVRCEETVGVRFRHIKKLYCQPFYRNAGELRMFIAPDGECTIAHGPASERWQERVLSQTHQTNQLGTLLVEIAIRLNVFPTNHDVESVLRSFEGL